MAPKTSDVSWMNVTMITIVKGTKLKSGPFEYAESMSKRPERSVCIGNIIYYLIYLLSPFPRGLEVDLDGSSTFPILMLSIQINRLGLFCHFYGVYSAVLPCSRVARLVLQPSAWKLGGTSH